MLKTFEQAAALIGEKKLLHISGSGKLLRNLPDGNWIGGSTEYFMEENGGQISDTLLDVQELAFGTYKLASYGTAELPSITTDAYPNGFSVIILPFDSEVHRQYAQNAADYDNIFLKNIVGWISGLNLNAPEQIPIAVNGSTGEAFADKAVVLHISLPEDKTVCMSIVNIFTPDANSPLITFGADGFNTETCLVDGKEVVFADYIAENGLDTKLPLVGDYSGAGINISIKSIDGGTVHFYAPVFKGIQYRFAESIPDYAAAFNEKIKELGGADAEFSCNCILNFLYGELEGKKLGGFYGPITFGEIAWQLLNQTLVYLRI
ncbi:MAG: hypothetical protein LBT26_02120, partial [Clostridiales Family XIII bacterium]|nr:hypothetical protein [Clostridiales Family XIII bacterium]